MEERVKRIIFFILIIINCITIFYFSSEQGEKSGSTSGRIVNFISEIIPQIRNLEESKKLELQENILQPLVRKTAHFSIYTLLGIFTMNFALTFKATLRQKSLSTLAFGFLYASTDEIHQLFVGGRSGMFTDVLIDTLGVITGIFLVILIKKIIKKEYKYGRKYEK